MRLSSLICLAAVLPCSNLCGADSRTEAKPLGGASSFPCNCDASTGNPKGVESERPRLSWRLELESGQSRTRGVVQTACRVLVASTPDLLKDGKGDLWDSGKAASDQSVHVEYRGKPLPSRQQCYWKVRVWDNHGQPSAWSQPTTWSMGLLKADDWQGCWIGESEKYPDAALLLRKEIRIEKPVKRAVAYMSGLGMSELYIEGRRVGNQVLSPAFTDYSKRVEYIVHDVTEYLHRGVSAIGVVLGNGYKSVPHKGWLGWYGNGGPPCLLLQIEIEFGDGSTQTVVSDESWKWSTGEIISTTCGRGDD